MRQTRRTWLSGTGTALLVGLAGCAGILGDDGGESTPEREETDQPSNGETATEQSADSTDAAVVAEWNAIRTRLRDPVILGHAEEFAAGASVAAHVFERFETASGEHNAHETLEDTSEEHYEGFEEGLSDLREALEAEDLERAHDAMHTADEHLRGAQGALVGSEAVKPLNVLVMGAHVADAALLAQVGDFEDAAGEFSQIGTKFEEKGLRELLAEADAEAADTFASALDRGASAAESEDAETATTAANEVIEAATQGSYALLPESVAGAAHVGALQGRGWDAAALAGLGGPATEFAHAAALTVYRARVHDAAWLYERGRADAALERVENVFAHFEGARAHEALEEASEDAYHRFEDDGLSALSTAIENDDFEGVATAVETINEALVDGIEALGSGDEPALLEAGYVKARIEDAVERYRLGEAGVAAETARDVFETFEANEADFHETLEETDESLYERFEDEHLTGLIKAFEGGDDGAVEEHVAGIRETLLSFETTAGTTAHVSAVESGYTAARVFDAGTLSDVGDSDRAASVVQAAFQHFEAGAGGFHEALEEADHDRYESFEDALDAAGSAARDGGNVAERARGFNGEAVGAIYAVVASAGGSFGLEAASVMQDTFAHFEEARVHEALEEADRDAYEGFERMLEEYIGALDSGSDVDASAEAFAQAALRAQFAVAGAPDAAPVDGSEISDGEEGESELEGGPNVVEDVPDDADHVIDMNAVAFEPAELTVSQGDTVAWTHAAGEAHSVSAYQDDIPEDAEYWASGGFESEDAARTGWENGQGAVQSGQSYIHTFETTGTHEYFCIPHEAAGMVGSVTVE
jgi:plastocyanin